MLDPSAVALLIAHSAFFITGSMENIFILLVNFLDWLKSRKLGPCDQIINCLGFFNLFFQGTVVINEFCIRLWTGYFQDFVVKIFVSIQIFLFFSSLWSCTFLCFYYCVKIIHFSSSFFFLLKANISKIVPWFLTLFVLVSVGFSLPAFWELYKDFSPVPGNFSGNVSSSLNYIFKSKCNCLFRIYLCLSSAAFTIFTLLAVTILISLCRHMQRVSKNSDGFDARRLAAHISATRTVTLLLVLYISFYIALNFIFSSPAAVGTLLFSLSMLMISSFPSLNALILITGNTKLKNVLKKIFLATTETDTSELHNTECNAGGITSSAG
ncbi:taste receptor type 2 member 4-like [Bombina bombina]|uniref:taste receptor type 2 member 4-like n=1 Tax=Bombina bombina TaxID=8345 RepID=UPI00235ABD5E|nr:taste receptor type 2 member 4-like [Bombina bombina]